MPTEAGFTVNCKALRGRNFRRVRAAPLVSDGTQFQVFGQELHVKSALVITDCKYLGFLAEVAESHRWDVARKAGNAATFLSAIASPILVNAVAAAMSCAGGLIVLESLAARKLVGIPGVVNMFTDDEALTMAGRSQPPWCCRSASVRRMRSWPECRARYTGGGDTS